MSLNWSVRLCTNAAELQAEEEQKITTPLIMLTMALDLPGITADNVEEWIFRLQFSARCGLVYYHSTTKDGARVPWWPSREDITKRIGLSTNVTQRTRKQWIKRVVQHLEYEVEAEIRNGIDINEVRE